MKKYCIGLPIFLLCIHILFAQETIRFDRINIENGLSQSIVQCILQDSKGFMWFGTEDGLNKYDGYKFTFFRQSSGNSNGLSNNNIYSLYEDKNQVLWIGTFYGGITTFDQKTGKFTQYRNIPGNSKSLSNNVVNAIYEDRSGVIWIGTNWGLNRFDRKFSEFKTYLNKQGNFTETNAIRSIFEDHSGGLWIGTDKGLNRFDRQRGVFIPFPNIPELFDSRIQAILEDKDQRLWIGTRERGLFVLNLRNSQVVSYNDDLKNSSGILSNNIRSIYQTRSGRLWIGTTNGLNAFDNVTGRFHQYQNVPGDTSSLSNNDIRSIYEDRSGVIWFGTYGGGISKYNGNNKKFDIFNRLSDPIVWSFLEDKDGTLWVGTQGGLDRIDRKNNIVRSYRNIPSNPNTLSNNIVRVLFQDKMGIIWVGTHGGGLNRFDPNTGIFKRYTTDNSDISHNELRCIYEDKKGTLWIGTNGGGLNRYNSRTDNFTVYRNDPTNPKSINNNYVRCILEDNNNNFWVGTQGGGLENFDREKETFTHCQNDPANIHSLSNDFIFAIYEDQKKTLWIGTYGGGLNRLENKKAMTFKRFGLAEGLSSNSILGILEEENGNLWISTNSGLSQFDFANNTFKNYTDRDGLQSNEFNGGSCYKSRRTGEMFFGGINGFNAFFPGKIVNSSFIPPIVITSFLKKNEIVVLDSPITEIKELVLHPLDYFFSFEFASLDYSAPQKNMYKYKMEGLDKDWISTDSLRRFAVYTTLEPGPYVFKVIGTNSDGQWNTEGTSIRIIIEPPFYKTLLFKIIIGVLILLIVLRLHRMRTNRIKQRMEKRRLETEIRLKADFTAMLVHDLRSPLTAVMGYAELLSYPNSHLDIVKTGQTISRSSRKMLNLINDMLDLSKFEAGKMKLYNKVIPIVKVIAETVESISPIFTQKEINIQSLIEPDVQNVMFNIDPEKIAQVLENFLSNAAKFAPIRGAVILKAGFVNENLLEVSVCNDGPTVLPEKQKQLFNKYAQLEGTTKEKGTGLGLAVSKIIIESHGGEIGYRTGPDGKGSIFFFRLPKYEESI